MSAPEGGGATPAPARSISEPYTRVEGNGNVVVQVVGDGNTVVTGYAHLELTRYLWRRDPEIAAADDLQLLHPYSYAIPLIGREPVLRDLESWLSGPKPVSVRLLTASGGVGKTRLALELCDRAAEGRLGLPTGAAEEGPVRWNAGFVTSEEFERFRTQQNPASWGWQRPTLIVVDYAAAKLGQLKLWLKELAANRGDPARPLRVLLLERHADPEIGWFWELIGRGDATADDVKRLFAPAVAVPLPRLEEPADRRAVFTAMLARLRAAGTSPVAVSLGTEFDRRLAEHTWGGDPLFLMMAAMTAARAGVDEALALSRTDAACKIADGERERLRRLAQVRGQPAGFVEHLAAYATLCQGIPADAVLDIVETEQRALRRDGAGAPADLAAVLVEALPDGAGGVAPVLPDVVGEALVLRALGEPSLRPAGAVAAVERTASHAWNRVVPVLIRLAQDFGETPGVRSSPIPWVARLAELAAHDFRRLAGLVEQLPAQTLVLRELAAELTGRLAEVLLPSAGVEAGEMQRAARAGVLNSHAVRLSDLGQLEAALVAIEEAVRLHRELSAARPHAFRPSLASSLNNLSNRLSDLGKRDDALATSKEAVELYREVTAAFPGAFLPDFASSLNNYANRLSDVGQHMEALAASQESVSLYRQLEAAHPGTFRPDLALSLNNLANRRTALRQHDAALVAIEEAAAIRRGLAAENPDAFRSDLAISLNSLTIALSDVRRHKEALATSAEAVSLYRQLESAHPDAFRPVLARSLNNHANQLSNVGRHEEALAASQEAVRLFRQLAAARPDAFRPSLALSLNNLANRLTALEQHEAALVEMKEAVTIRRELAAENPGAFGPALARSLFNLSSEFAAVGRIDEALRAATEGVETLRPHFLALPDAFADLMERIAGHYVSLAENAGVPVDHELLAPIDDAFERLRSDAHPPKSE